MSDKNARQQIIDEIKQVDNILVTVSRNPSVDALSAALGFTLLINKLSKHGTAIFSGDIPPAITFLDPKKTFENTVDSLRDFIIALDKEKADHLRYKLVGDMVKIFITPYRTTITDQDLDFSQGDYNVEMVIAIGVENSDDLDTALADHGRILHDATVASISIGDETTDLGTINWHEKGASSYSELLAGMAEGLRSDKTLLDEQAATAFLTGIVAATDRFSNQRTSSQAMTISAKLMAAGANQQLIATKLEEAEQSEETSDDAGQTKHDGSTELVDGKASKIDRKQAKKNTDSDDKPAQSDNPDAPAPDGTLTISHEKRGDVDAVRDQVHAETQAASTKRAEDSLREHEQLQESIAEEKTEQDSAEDALAQKLAESIPAASTPSVADLQKDLRAAEFEIDEAASQPAQPDMTLPQPGMADEAPEPAVEESVEPSFGGILNATSEQAAIDKQKQQNDDRNKTILTHASAPLDSQPREMSQVNSFSQPAGGMNQGEPLAVDPFGGQAPTVHAQDIAPLTPVTPQVESPVQTLADIDSANRADARDAIDAALNAGSQPSFEQPILSPVQPPVTPAQMPVNGLPPLPDLPPLPPMPSDFSQLPPLPSSPNQSPEDQLSAVLSPAPILSADQAPAPASDPGQFQIPGQ